MCYSRLVFFVCTCFSFSLLGSSSNLSPKEALESIAGKFEKTLPEDLPPSIDDNPLSYFKEIKSFYKKAEKKWKKVIPKKYSKLLEHLPMNEKILINDELEIKKEEGVHVINGKNYHITLKSKEELARVLHEEDWRSLRNYLYRLASISMQNLALVNPKKAKEEAVDEKLADKLQKKFLTILSEMKNPDVDWLLEQKKLGSRARGRMISRLKKENPEALMEIIEERLGLEGSEEE